MKKRNIINVLAITILIVLLSGCRSSDEGKDDKTVINSLPAVYINIDESKGTIEDMLGSADHSVYCYGTLSIEVPEGFHYADYPDLELKNYEDLAISLRGRGNSTWNQKDKKPFKIKLDEKEDIFGFGENKHWVLLANAFDPSLLRNRITYHLCETLDFEFTPQGVPVDLYLTGEKYGTKYLGNYYLGENIRVGKNRLDIGELKEDDVDIENITGGYLLQNALQVEEGSPDRFNTTRGEAWATDTPSFNVLDGGYENEAQRNYIRDHMNKVEDVLYDGGKAYRELLDVKSAASYWLINTLSMNLDAYKTSSTYIYKKADKDGVTGKLYWGPAWDYDYAWDQGETYEGMTAGHTWVKPLFTDRSEGGFIEEVLKQWPILKQEAEQIIAKDGLLDKYYLEMKESADKDHEVNPGDDNDEYSYKDKVENLRTWIRNRIDWIDSNIQSIDEMVHTITYYVDGKIVARDYCDVSESIMILPLEPEKEGCLFMGWVNEDGEAYQFDISTDKDLNLFASFIDEKDAVQPEQIILSKDSDIVRYDPDNRVYLMEWVVLPSDAYDKWVDFTSSDENIATVSVDGEVLIKGVGQTTITITTRNGITKDFVLTVTEDEIELPEKIVVENEVINMKVSEVVHIAVHSNPIATKVGEYLYESDNPEIADVDMFGIVTALKPGTAHIHVTANTEINGVTHSWETWVTVNVSDN